MVSTTTIRVDQETHRRLVAISRASNRPLIDVLRDALRQDPKTGRAT